MLADFGATDDSNHVERRNLQPRRSRQVRDTRRMLEQAERRPSNSIGKVAPRLLMILIAKALLRRGLLIIPCNGKQPCDADGRPLSGWPEMAISEERVVAGGQGANDPAIGLILGPQSGIIDIGADSEEERKGARVSTPPRLVESGLSGWTTPCRPNCRMR